MYTYSAGSPKTFGQLPMVGGALVTSAVVTQIAASKVKIDLAEKAVDDAIKMARNAEIPESKRRLGKLHIATARAALDKGDLKVANESARNAELWASRLAEKAAVITGEQTKALAQTTTKGIPRWVWIAGGVGLLAVVGMMAFGRKRPAAAPAAA